MQSSSLNVSSNNVIADEEFDSSYLDAAFGFDKQTDSKVLTTQTRTTAMAHGTTPANLSPAISASTIRRIGNDRRSSDCYDSSANESPSTYLQGVRSAFSRPGTGTSKQKTSPSETDRSQVMAIFENEFRDATTSHTATTESSKLQQAPVRPSTLESHTVTSTSATTRPQVTPVAAMATPAINTAQKTTTTSLTRLLEAAKITSIQGRRPSVRPPVAKNGPLLSIASPLGNPSATTAPPPTPVAQSRESQRPRNLASNLSTTTTTTLAPPSMASTTTTTTLAPPSVASTTTTTTLAPPSVVSTNSLLPPKRPAKPTQTFTDTPLNATKAVSASTASKRILNNATLGYLPAALHLESDVAPNDIEIEIDDRSRVMSIVTPIPRHSVIERAFAEPSSKTPFQSSHSKIDAVQSYRSAQINSSDVGTQTHQDEKNNNNSNNNSNNRDDNNSVYNDISLYISFMPKIQYFIISFPHLMEIVLMIAIAGMIPNISPTLIFLIIWNSILVAYLPLMNVYGLHSNKIVLPTFAVTLAITTSMTLCFVITLILTTLSLPEDPGSTVTARTQLPSMGQVSKQGKTIVSLFIISSMILLVGVFGKLLHNPKNDK